MGDCNCDPRKHGKRFFKAGACYNGVYDDDNFDRCVLFGNECNEGQEYRYHRDQCEPSDMSVGRCLQEDTCAVRVSDCAENNSTFNFSEKDVACTLQRDKKNTWNTDDPQFTQFGSCYNENTKEFFCIYDPSECEESNQEVYLTPKETLVRRGTPCDCSEVHVTACVGCSGRSHCVLRNEDCPEDTCVESARSPHFQRTEREEGKDNLDCRLCMRVNTPPPTTPPTKSISPTHIPTKSTPPTRTPTRFSPPTPTPTKSPTISPSMSSNNESNKGMIIGASIGGAAALLLTGGLIYMLGYRIKQKREDDRLRRKNRKKRNTPPLEISIS